MKLREEDIADQLERMLREAKRDELKKVTGIMTNPSSPIASSAAVAWYEAAWNALHTARRLLACGEPGLALGVMSPFVTNSGQP